MEWTAGMTFFENCMLQVSAATQLYNWQLQTNSTPFGPKPKHSE